MPGTDITTATSGASTAVDIDAIGPRQSGAAQTRNGPPGFWLTVVRPEVLFLLGTLQALLPYLLWLVRGTGRKYVFEITYLPLLFWILGYAAFWIGCRLAPKPRASRKPLVPSARSLAIVGSVAIAIILAILAAIIRVYGGIPLLQFAQHTTNIVRVNAMLWQTGAGRLGLLSILLFFLNAVLVALILGGRNRPRIWDRLFVVLGLAVEVFGCVFAGKRQGLVISIVFFCVAFCIAAGDPFLPLFRFFGVPRARLAARSAVIVAPLVLVMSLGAMFALRTERTGIRLNDLVHYLEYPLMNFEAQCKMAGVGPYELAPGRLVKMLLPYRMTHNADGSEIGRGPRPRYPEPTAPLGFYGDLQWNAGIGGALMFALLAGLAASFLYRRAAMSLFCLMAYAQVSWALLGAHSYNNFLNLVVVPLPIAAFSSLTFLAWLERRG